MLFNIFAWFCFLVRKQTFFSFYCERSNYIFEIRAVSWHHKWHGTNNFGQSLTLLENGDYHVQYNIRFFKLVRIYLPHHNGAYNLRVPRNSRPVCKRSQVGCYSARHRMIQITKWEILRRRRIIDSPSSKYDLMIRQKAKLLASHLYFSFRFYQIVNNDHHQHVCESHCCTKTNHCHLYHAQ